MSVCRCVCVCVCFHFHRLVQAGSYAGVWAELVRDQFQRSDDDQKRRARPPCGARKQRGQRELVFGHKSQRQNTPTPECLCCFNKPSEVRKRKRVSFPALWCEVTLQHMCTALTRVCSLLGPPSDLHRRQRIDASPSHAGDLTLELTRPATSQCCSKCEAPLRSRQPARISVSAAAI